MCGSMNILTLLGPTIWFLGEGYGFFVKKKIVQQISENK